MTPSELAAIEARLRAATPGPWAEVTTEDSSCGRVYAIGRNDEALVACVSCNDFECHPMCDADAEFIANAPTDIAALLAEVAEFRAHVSRAIFERKKAEDEATALMERAHVAEEATRRLADKYKALTQSLTAFTAEDIRKNPSAIVRLFSKLNEVNE